MDIAPPSHNPAQAVTDHTGALMPPAAPVSGMPDPTVGDAASNDQTLGQLENAVNEIPGPATPPPFDQVTTGEAPLMAPPSVAPPAPMEPPVMAPPAVAPPTAAPDPDPSENDAYIDAITNKPQHDSLQTEESDELSTEEPAKTHHKIDVTPRNEHDKPAEPSDLDDVKKKALHALAPIANKLDIPAEERFKTMMQLIQATDNHELTGAAFEAAESIESESERAQALLDVVNEIEYLEQQDKKDK